MKLYTEEDVLHMLRCFHTLELNVQLCMCKLTPIELPSDEEIAKKSKGEYYIEEQSGFINGAVWIKEQIINQNQII